MIKSIKSVKSQLIFIISIIYLIQQNQCNLLNQRSDKKKNPFLGKIRIKDKWFIDPDNRIVLFHGINAVEKNFPWLPTQARANLTNRTQLDNLKRWGMNVVRLGFMWSGLYPQKGVVNQSYVNEMVKIVQTLEERGIWVIIDLHQDMLSSQFASYDGAPAWILEQLPPPKHKYPWPFKNEYLGFGAYVTDACGFAFQCLYKNINNFERYFHDYWTTVAQIFNSTSSVLGYELINEPWAGDIYADPLLLLPGISDKLNLLPLYDRVYAKIRQYDQETIVFYEPVTWGVMSNNTFVGTGFDHAPGHDPTRTSLAWHYYCWLLNFDTDPIRNDSMPIFVRQVCDSWQLNLYFETVANDLARIGGGVSFLTEFGVCIFRDDVTHKINLDECKATLEASDKHFVSWAYWNSVTFYNNVSYEVDYDIVNEFSRVYPTATNGIPLALNYNSSTRFFSYIFDFNVTTHNQASIATEIFVPLHLYPNWFNVTVSSNLKWKFDNETSKLMINLNDAILDGLKQVESTNLFTTISSVIIQSISQL